MVIETHARTYAFIQQMFLEVRQRQGGGGGRFRLPSEPQSPPLETGGSTPLPSLATPLGPLPTLLSQNLPADPVLVQGGLGQYLTPCPEAPPISPSPGPQTCRSICMCIPHRLEAWRAPLTQYAQPYPLPHLISPSRQVAPRVPPAAQPKPAGHPSSLFHSQRIPPSADANGAPSQIYLEPNNPVFPPPALLPAPGHLRSLLGSSHLAGFPAPNRAPLGLHPKPL